MEKGRRWQQGRRGLTYVACFHFERNVQLTLRWREERPPNSIRRTLMSSGRAGSLPACLSVCFHLPRHLPWFPDLWGWRPLWKRRTSSIILFYFIILLLQFHRLEVRVKHEAGVLSLIRRSHICVLLTDFNSQGNRARRLKAAREKMHHHQPLTQEAAATSWCTLREKPRLKSPLRLGLRVHF